MSLQFDGISHRHGRHTVLSDVAFEVPAGAITCLLGGSGSGKTTLLNLAAGLLPVQAGQISLDGEVIARPGASPPPEARPVGLVFQEGALFPHMTVADNVTFGLPRRPSKEELAALLEQVDLAGYEKRYPETLSGGQQQRVALARALAPAPRVLLLDEPFANIDVVLRQRLRQLTRSVLLERACIPLFVTHDPLEAMEIADRIVLLADSRIVQQGTPADLYDAPATLDVAQMVGGGLTVSGVMNGASIETPFGIWPRAALASGDDLSGPVRLVVRDGMIALREASSGVAQVTDVQNLGPKVRVKIKGQGGASMTLSLPRGAVPQKGAVVTTDLLPGGAHAFQTER